MALEGVWTHSAPREAEVSVNTGAASSEYLGNSTRFTVTTSIGAQSVEARGFVLGTLDNCATGNAAMLRA